MEVSRRKCSLFTSALSPFNYRNSETPCIFLGGENFALTRQLVKPNSQRDQRKNVSATTGIARTDEPLKNFLESQSIVGVFSCQLFYYHINQLKVSCKQPLCSMANQEKFNQLISTVHRILLIQKPIKRSNTRILARINHIG